MERDQCPESPGSKTPPPAAELSTAERLLLKFVGTVTRHAYRITDEQVQGLRDAGWTDAQIAEAVYDAALLNFFNRIADAFDIRPPVAPDPIDPPRHCLTQR